MGDEFRTGFGEGNYKSCFARSVAVNAQYNQIKSGETDKIDGNRGAENANCCDSAGKSAFSRNRSENLRIKKNPRITEEWRRYSVGTITPIRQSPATSSRIKDLPFENMVHNSRIETIQWQLKEVEKSREMYRALLKQVVTFLEKAHHSLENFGNRLNKKNHVPRSRSEHQIVVNCGSNQDSPHTLTQKPDRFSEDVPPEKLAQEAFRLLRTTESLLNTQEPNLIPTDETSDIEFLNQLAKEFPQQDPRPQRTTSFSYSPKLILPENEIKISKAFNRKLSLQLGEIRKVSALKIARCGSSGGSDCGSDFHSVIPKSEEFLPDPEARVKGKDNSGSPATASVSSMEDESGFSSLNSFQEVGLPLINTPNLDKISARNSLLQSMLHQPDETNSAKSQKDVWQKPGQPKRWQANTSDELCNQSVNVLWV